MRLAATEASQICLNEWTGRWHQPDRQNPRNRPNTAACYILPLQRHKNNIFGWLFSRTDTWTWISALTDYRETNNLSTNVHEAARYTDQIGGEPQLLFIHCVQKKP